MSLNMEYLNKTLLELFHASIGVIPLRPVTQIGCIAVGNVSNAL